MNTIKPHEKHTRLALTVARIAAVTSLFICPALHAEITTRPRPSGDAFRVVTANTRQLLGGAAEPSKTEDDWEHRKNIARDVLIAQNADIYCFQECRKPHLDHFLETMRDFAYFSVPQHVVPGNAIMYSTTRFEFLAADGFWLSETPYVPGSSSWGSGAIRYVNWVRLKDKKTNRVFLIWCLHLDDQSATARQNQIAVFLRSAALQPADAPQFIFADFNCGPNDAPFLSVKNAGWRDTYVEGGGAGQPDPGRTFHNFMGPNYSPGTGAKIDHIFIRGALRATAAEVIKDYITVDGVNRYPSDHYFVSAVVEFDTSVTAVEPRSYTAVKYKDFSAPAGMALDAAGTLYVADEGAHVINKVTGIAGTGTKTVSAYAGVGGGRGYINGAAARSLFATPRSLALQDGFWYVADSGNKAVRLIKTDTSEVSLYLGNPYAGAPVDGDINTARFGEPAAIRITRAGIIYVADAGAHAIRRIETNGDVRTIAGQLNTRGFSDAASGTAALFNEPAGLALNADETALYVADAGNNIIRKIALDNADYAVSTIAGNASVAAGFADGTGAAALFDAPSDLVVSAGTLFVADTGNHVIRAVNLTSNTVVRLAGTPGAQPPPLGVASVKDGGPDEALFSYPSGIISGANGILYIADSGNGTIRALDLNNGAAVATPLESKPVPSGSYSPPPAPPSPSGDGGGGGGAVSLWSLLALAALFVFRISKKDAHI